MSGRVVAVEGASASGKTTAVGTAARRSGWTVVTEAYHRIDPRPSLEFRSSDELVDLERRLLEEDARRYSEARGLADGGATVLADTGFLGPLTYTSALVATGAAPPAALASVVGLARMLQARGAWDLADVYLYLDTPSSIRSARARADPSGHPADLTARHARIGDVEHRFYAEEFAPLLGDRFRWVSGAGPASVVAGRVVDAVRETAALPVRDVSVTALLAVFDARIGASDSSRGNR